MAGRRLKRLIPGHFADLCESKNIKTVQDLIERPDLDIIDALDISVGQSDEMLNQKRMPLTDMNIYRRFGLRFTEGICNVGTEAKDCV
mmetsp:Transcript_13897/g.23378  ORF Transcript_13897/g.23378 Transcript_13897/m.23378 type:complete len:88 (-) Transcript_13897:858-1121(-)